jgi:hypothetical protein
MAGVYALEKDVCPGWVVKPHLDALERTYERFPEIGGRAA